MKGKHCFIGRAWAAAISSGKRRAANGAQEPKRGEERKTVDAMGEMKLDHEGGKCETPQKALMRKV